VEGVLHDPTGNAIQFGEYLTIPGLAASALLGALLVVPFVLGVPWATRRPRAGTLVLSPEIDLLVYA